MLRTFQMPLVLSCTLSIFQPSIVVKCIYTDVPIILLFHTNNKKGVGRSKATGSVVVYSLLIVAPIVVFCVCSMFCCTLLCVLSSFAIILMEKRELVALLFVFLMSCSSPSPCHRLVCSASLWYFLIILTYFFHTHPFFKDSAKELDRGYHAISRT